jgi:hypothetical protein
LRDYTIVITESARKFIKEHNIRDLYIEINYINGPCTDNFCRLIPKPEIVYVKPKQETFLLSEGTVNVFCTRPIIDSLKKFGGELTIKYSSIRRKLVLKDLPYNF